MSRPAKSGTAASQRSIRLTDAEWQAFQAMGGTDWLRRQLTPEVIECDHRFTTQRLIDNFRTCIECGWTSEPDEVCVPASLLATTKQA